jgi:methyltransferase-like protein/SAM-dependent methyltransferase/Fe-S-cluster containining protein
MTEVAGSQENQSGSAAEPLHSEWRTANVELALGARRLKVKITVPAGPTRLLQMLPVVQALTDAAVGAAVEDVEAQGHKVSCRKGCGACCRQLVPISPVEARHIHNLVDELPEPRRSEIKARFADARQRLAQAGLLEQLLHPETWPDEGGRQLGLKYFFQGIPCPFLEEESCSIYPDRPLECRQYLVTSPAENCKNPTGQTVHQVPVSINPWRALARVSQPGTPGGKVPWVPLILAPEWAESHPNETPLRPGPELLQQVFENLTGKDLPHPWREHQLLPPPSQTRESRVEDQASKIEPSAAAKTSYDDIPYLGNPRLSTHPDNLATVATLLGMKPTPIDSCRVLELGCGTGGNLIPMALTLPQSRFVGIDLSSQQIASGRALAEAVGLTNIELKPLSVMDVDDSFGQFDYIICHGVYSWVPPAVQDKILTICKGNLAPNGIAYVSYNTYPGWHQRGLVREILNYHVRQFDDPKVRTQQARAFLDFLGQSVVDQNGPYARVLHQEAELIKKVEDWYVFHEHLEDYNEPLYFHQFAQRAAAKGLQYLGEAWNHTYVHNLRPEVRDTLQQLSGDLLHLEQYVDFLRNRMFRQTLLCHDQVALNRAPAPEVVMDLKITSMARPMAADPDVASTAAEEFRNDDETSLSTNKPQVKAALVCLYEAWPRAFSFDELWIAAQARLSGAAVADGQRGEAGRALLAKDLLQCYLTNMVALHVHMPSFAPEAGARPLASPLARVQAHQQPAGKLITTLFHRQVELSDLDLVVLPYLDGSRDRAALVDALQAAVADGSLKIEKNGQRPPRETIPAILKEALEICLQRLARFGLLTA